MPATNKTDLLAVTQKEYEKLFALLEKVPEDLANLKDVDDTSIKDVVAHRAHWIALFRGWYHDGLAGKPVFFPAEGYKWNDLKRYNADLRARQSGLDWRGALDLLESEASKLNKLLTDMPDNALYGGPMKGANNAWTVGRWAEAAGPSHYRSAAKYVRQRLKSSG